ncbi:hypothetical protein ARALYDRAFT_314773 [Arabidopsis lyrata subsp. lyrata]|uniref:V-type proton ATPase subunit S1/VOA1 transmembrane domain-containing protein n=1 Tax=Arabidopsis lyrata subsp. lyrata TaxID=81972 RepID=D7KMA7_ARALL|nr:uncharacterized protein LOC9327902 [Arabidopsis lyrata subsp. lyrata]EFH68099.1 hypothetical protein ARALYDRAFT_314773 [Arabidopsis lyrata subsp. lyrata]|eukprot:XP_002891840.1 uncharacterized protein LOC9327902 [Arabidopsis lyrata subsp. lyrata]
MMRMRIVLVALLVALDFGLASPSTVPAFLWSPHLQSANGEMDVNYQVMSAKDLVDSVFTQGGWSNFLCSEKNLQQPVDVALVFIGRELLSSDVSSNRNSDPALVNILKNLYTASNFSLAFPYIAAPEEERMENLLLSGLKEACAHNVGVTNVVFSDSCFVEDGTIQKLSNVQSFKDHLVARKETRKEGETDLVVLCSGGSESSSQSDQSHSDREIISELVSSVEQSETKYTALYVSDPYWYTSYQTLQRFLAEAATGNTTAEATTTCDELCKFKSSLLEGILVGIVFLLILISGLCCMAGIDTPTRFETPQDS